MEKLNPRGRTGKTSALRCGERQDASEAWKLTVTVAEVRQSCSQNFSFAGFALLEMLLIEPSTEVLP